MPERFLIGILALCMVASLQAAQDVSTHTLRLTFSDSGNLDAAVACFPSCSDEHTRMQQFADGNLVAFEPFTGGEWRHTSEQSELAYRIHFTHSSGASVKWTIPARGYRIELELDAPGDVAVRSGESFRPGAAEGFGTWLERSRYLVLGNGDVTRIRFDEQAGVTADDSRWLGYRNRHWAFLAEPPALNRAVLQTGEAQQDAVLQVTAEPGKWSFYIGPVEPVVLEQAAPGLGDIQFAGLWFGLRWICMGMYFLLGWINLAIPSWGVSIMALSLIVTILMTPLSRIAERFKQEADDIEARLAPGLQRIKGNCRGHERAGRILALYRAEKVHPLYRLKSMAGVVLLIPIFIGAFGMLAGNIHLLNVSFLWISDLSRPDSLFGLPFNGTDFNLLPLLMAGLYAVASVLQQPPALHAELRRKKRIRTAFLAMLLFGLFYTFPAGMVLYWTTNHLVSAGKGLWAMR